MPRTMGGISSVESVRGGVSIRVLGVEELVAKLYAINRIANLRVGVALAHAAHEIEQNAIDNAPEETGNLKTSIHASKLGVNSWQVIADTTTGTDPGGEGKNSYEYAGYVEYGTSRTPAQPFMGPAVEDGQNTLWLDLQEIAAAIEAL